MHLRGSLRGVFIINISCKIRRPSYLLANLFYLINIKIIPLSNKWAGEGLAEDVNGLC